MIKPILFSTPMIQAILQGRKTQTRRKIKFPKDWITEDNLWDWVALQDLYPEVFKKYSVGDVLWVRETVLFYSDENGNDAVLYKADPDVDEFSIGLFEGKPKWKPSIFMPKAACRIFLEITDVRIERLQDISEEDAKAEGAFKRNDNGFDVYRDSEDKYNELQGFSFKTGFKFLWQKINGAESWEANPFVWVVSFKQITKPENFK